MADEISSPGPLPTEALAFFKAKKLHPAFDYRDVWAEEHAVSFTVAKMMQMDLLQATQDSLAAALKDGTPFAQWKKQLMPTLADAGWLGRKTVTDPVTGEEKTVTLGTPRRLATIYDVNMRGARAAGQWERVQRTKETLPYLLWQLGPSKVHREQHVKWNGTLLPADDPFWQQHTPPCGYGCKCWLRQVSKPEHEELTAPDSKRGEQLAIKTSRPEEWDKTTEYVNGRTGEVTRNPVGVTPGFGYNPGEVSRAVQLQQAFGEKMKGVETPIVKQTVADLVQSPAFDLFLRKPQGNFPVAALEAAIADLVQAKNAPVYLSDTTLLKNRQAHPEILDDDYRLLPAIVNEGTVVQIGDQKLSFFRRDGKLYKAVLKTTADGNESYVVSVFRTDDGEMRRDLKRGTLVRDAAQ